MFSMVDMYKIGIGPSSSHTIGPMKAGHQFLSALKESGQFSATTAIKVDLFGSLALTGKGHCTDQAIILGLSGHQPDSVDPEIIGPTVAEVVNSGQLQLGKTQQVVGVGGEYHDRDAEWEAAASVARYE